MAGDASGDEDMTNNLEYRLLYLSLVYSVRMCACPFAETPQSFWYGSPGQYVKTTEEPVMEANKPCIMNTTCEAIYPLVA